MLICQACGTEDGSGTVSAGFTNLTKQLSTYLTEQLLQPKELTTQD